MGVCHTLVVFRENAAQCSEGLLGRTEFVKWREGGLWRDRKRGRERQSGKERERQRQGEADRDRERKRVVPWYLLLNCQLCRTEGCMAVIK